MSTSAGLVAAILFPFILATGSAWADSKSIQGTLIGKDGNPLSGAEIRAERLDAKTPPATTKTDAHGRYVFKTLPVGAYAVTAYVKNAPSPAPA